MFYFLGVDEMSLADPLLGVEGVVCSRGDFLNNDSEPSRVRRLLARGELDMV